MGVEWVLVLWVTGYGGQSVQSGLSANFPIMEKEQCKVVAQAVAREWSGVSAICVSAMTGESFKPVKGWFD